MYFCSFSVGCCEFGCQNRCSWLLGKTRLCVECDVKLKRKTTHLLAISIKASLNVLTLLTVTAHGSATEVTSVM